uniref:Uncharacterized protein n=1 Tax=Anopheles atroparvus TaxID=41427 RepID=A0AAG5DBZ3_ANOAO
QQNVGRLRQVRLRDGEAHPLGAQWQAAKQEGSERPHQPQRSERPFAQDCDQAEKYGAKQEIAPEVERLYAARNVARRRNLPSARTPSPHPPHLSVLSISSFQSFLPPLPSQNPPPLITFIVDSLLFCILFAPLLVTRALLPFRVFASEF